MKFVKTFWIEDRAKFIMCSLSAIGCICTIIFLALSVSTLMMATADKVSVHSIFATSSDYIETSIGKISSKYTVSSDLDGNNIMVVRDSDGELASYRHITNKGFAFFKLALICMILPFISLIYYGNIKIEEYDNDCED